ncbi:P-loop containing nucleoside triphosphate hydrolase protein [Lizonia empirigonia]|nr:P-loop containing nucleoside triphosphate hydrolase protein [Lizonia empirigonia]
MSKESLQDEKTLNIHKGPVFDVVTVNYTLETKNTQKNEIETSDRETEITKCESSSQKPPTVEYRGRGYVRIYSRAILNALQSVVNYYPGQDLVSQPTDIHWPYAIIIHHWTQLKTFHSNFIDSEPGINANECSVTDTNHHLKLLLDFVDKEMGEQVRTERERWKRDPPVASFDMLWLLLKPGIDIYEHLDNFDCKEAFVMSKVDFSPLDGSWESYSVTEWRFDNDSTSLRPVLRSKKIDRFHGERPIHELSIFPCEYHTTHITRRQELIERGRLFTSLQQKRCMYFDGLTIVPPQQAYRGYVVVDPVKALEAMPRRHEQVHHLVESKPSRLPLCSCERCAAIECERDKPAKFSGYKRIAFKDIPSMTEHQLFMCAIGVEAFVLSVRDWKGVLLTGIREPEWDLGLMEGLVLNEKYKNMLQRLCKLYMKQQAVSLLQTSEDQYIGRPWTADYIDSKGKGLVVLLHGKPGVGKTYTAECIAHTMRRPLLSISCADIGVDPPEVEKNLRKWFNLARTWDAVLLIDEADIYFESRETMDLKRNNLVASFLRVIEYYDGILFLTSNRIGTSDEAVWSRIHATIYYSDFTGPQRQQIWNTYFTKLEKDRADMIVSESARSYVESLEELTWNGREIRNAFQIAVNLAQTEKRDTKGRFSVTRDHIKGTVELLNDFKKYMHDLHGVTPEKRATRTGIRYDQHRASGQPPDSKI